MERVLDDVRYFLALDRAIKPGLALLGERYFTGSERVEGVVLSNTNVGSSHDLRTALADDDHTWACCLTIRKFHPEVFRV